MSGPALHAFTLKFLALKTCLFQFFGVKKNLNFLYNFSVQTIQYFQKKSFDPKKVKKRASKVGHNWPRPFYFTVQPRPQPTAQN